MTDETPRLDDVDEPQILEVEALPDDAPPPSGDDDEDIGADAAALSGTMTGHDGEVPAEATGAEEGEVENEEVATLRARLATMDDDLLRVRAEFDNFRKRQERQRSELTRRATATLIEQVLPVVDNFRRALDAKPTETGADDYQQGIRMIYEQLHGVLKKAGLTTIETAGQVFDPELHEAVAREETTEIEANIITEELEPGYLFQNRLLKPARVRVAVAPPA